MTATETSGGRPAPHDVFASLPRLDRHKPKGPPMRKSKVSRWRAAVLIGVHVLIGLHIWHWLATGETLTPVEPSEAMQAVELGRMNAGFWLFLFLIASTLLVGRFFCGWACHVVALQDLSAWLLKRVGLKPRPVRSRLLVFGPWVVGGYMFVWPAVEHWLFPPAQPTPGLFPSVDAWELQLTTTDLWQTFPGPIMTVMSVLVVGGLIVWWLGAKGFCTFGCPYGAFFAVADRVAPVRIVVDANKCEHCGHCTQACTSNVRVHEEVAKYQKVVDPGCMKCLDCVSVCPKDALSVGFAAPKPFAISQQRIRARSDFRWWEEIVLAVAAITAVVFVWRGAWFGEGVPLLLAVGLGVITSVLLLLTLRLLTRRDVTFQHTPLKLAGRWTRAGGLGLLGLALWLGLAAHTGVGRQLRASLYDEMLQMPNNATVEQLQATLDEARFAHAWDLFDDPLVGEMKGLLLRRLGNHAEAEAALRASLHGRRGLEFVEASLSLADYSMRPERRDFDLARSLVDGVLARFPEHPTARRMKAFLDSQPK